MAKDNVIDIKTKSPLFNPELKQCLQEGVLPYVDNQESSVKAVNAVEQIICTALVCAARSLATKLAAKVANLFSGDK